MLTYRDGTSDCVLPVGGRDWEQWLEQPGTSVFRFENEAARFTARREMQRGHWYWYGYRRRAGRLRKAYLGRSSDLTLERLADIGAKLDDAVDALVTPGDNAAMPAHPTLGGDRHNLPSQLSSFLGRQHEIAELQHILGTTRLLTLTGAGGVGKTRLALCVAASLLEDTVDAVWLVELAGLADPTLVPRAVAQAIGAREEPGRPLLTSVATGLRVGRVVVVLDNCEHLVDACASLAEHLLRNCPSLRILATSREPLGTSGEVTWRVPSLGLPVADETSSTLEDQAQPEAMQLFVDRARAARPGFVLTERNGPAVIEVCRRLDGIPLAIELAAARVRVLAPEEIADRLDDRFRLLVGSGRTAPPRQQTLRAAVDWSYDLLTDAEQQLFEELSVFVGGFTLDAAEAVCAHHDETQSSSVLDLLTRLVDRSLVLAEPQPGAETLRYRLLETLRVYGLQRLTERGEEALGRVRERHAAWMTAQAEQAERAFRGPGQRHWLRWAEREHDNARAVMAWALERGETDVALRLVAGLWWSWVVHQRWSEGLDWARRVLAVSNPTPTRARGFVLGGAVNLAVFQADVTSNRPSGNLSAIGDWVMEGLAIAEKLGDDELLLGARGLILLTREFGVNLAGAPEVSEEEVLTDARRIGHTWGECRGLEALARRAMRAADLDTASARLGEAVQVSREVGDTWSLAMALNELGDVARAQGDHARARVLYEESLELFIDLGLADQPSLAHNLGYVALAAGDPHQAAARFASALIQFRRWGDQRGMAECLMGFGALAAADGRASDAAGLFGAGEAALEALGMQIWASNSPDYERWQARARSSLNAEAFTRARAHGRGLGLEQAIAWALEPRPVPAARSRGRGTPQLTQREFEVAQLAAQGLSNREIAEVLVITNKTAANHLQHSLDKLEVRSRAQLAARAAEFGLRPADVRCHAVGGDVPDVWLCGPGLWRVHSRRAGAELPRRQDL